MATSRHSSEAFQGSLLCLKLQESLLGLRKSHLPLFSARQGHKQGISRLTPGLLLPRPLYCIPELLSRFLGRSWRLSSRRFSSSGLSFWTVLPMNKSLLHAQPDSLSCQHSCIFPANALFSRKRCCG